ncbi:MAG: rRNA maturation RNase YbeY [Firmicutes bacterium]|nr:rRNA maturation RNase YbeY [Bacillota bacterium]
MIIFENETDIDIDEELVDAVTKQVMAYEGIENEFEVSVTVTDPDTVHGLNKKYRDTDRTTDVLSFPLNEREDILSLDKSEKLYLGDIVLNGEKVVSQAEEYCHSLKRETAFLTAHSMLHLLGYDHMVKEEETVMFAKQEEILTIMGITR